MKLLLEATQNYFSAIKCVKRVFLALSLPVKCCQCTRRGRTRFVVGDAKSALRSVGHNGEAGIRAYASVPWRKRRPRTNLDASCLEN
jgi:hypothetical protein